MLGGRLARGDSLGRVDDDGHAGLRADLGQRIGDVLPLPERTSSAPSSFAVCSPDGEWASPALRCNSQSHRVFPSGVAGSWP